VAAASGLAGIKSLDQQHAGHQQKRKKDTGHGGGARRPQALTDQTGSMVHSYSEKRLGMSASVCGRAPCPLNWVAAGGKTAIPWPAQSVQAKLQSICLQSVGHCRFVVNPHLGAEARTGH
jgi:hypothetical protein